MGDADWAGTTVLLENEGGVLSDSVIFEILPLPASLERLSVFVTLEFAEEM